MWPRVCAALGKPDWGKDARFARRQDRARNARLINEAIEALLSTMTMKDAIGHFTNTTLPWRR